MKKLEINCPTCKIKYSYYESSSRPFCTEKCRMIDLGQWFEEAYHIKGKQLDPFDLEDQNLTEKILGTKGDFLE